MSTAMEEAEPSERKHKTSKTRRETAVQGTNDNSIVSKCSMSAAGYFHDPFLKEFVAKNSKRAPLINRGYYLRATCIDQVLKQFLAKNQGCRKQIVSLGAGFDSSYFRLKNEGLLQDTAFFEIDFPEVTKRKHAIINSKTELSSLLNLDGENKKLVPPIELLTKDYCLLGVDLTQLNTLEAALRLCGADFDTPTLLLSECVMTYMTRRCSSALVKWAGETFQDAIFVMFEQVNPDDAFGIFMQNHFHTIGSPLKCITSFPTVESQINRFLSLGWQKCKCHDLNEIYRLALTVEERARIETLDPFDEYEEFNLKCAHYFLLIASTSTSISDFLFKSAADGDASETQPVRDMISLTCVPPGKSSVKRFSHSSVLVENRYILTAGGFGEVDGRHQRVQEVSLTDTVTMETSLIRCHSDDIQYSRMHHSAEILSDGRMLLCAGRQSPFFLCTQVLVFDFHTHAHSRTASQQPGDASVCENNSQKEESSMVPQTEDNSCASCNMEDNDSYKETNGDGVRNDGSAAEHRNSEGNVLATTASNSSVCDNSADPVDVDCEDSTPVLLNRANGTRSGCHVLVSEKVERTNFEEGHVICSVLKQSGDAPCPRWRHASTLVNLDGRDCLFLHGGRTQKAEVLADIFMLDVFSGVWTKVACTGDVPGALHSHTMATWVDGETQWVVLSGGMDGDQCPQSSIYLLDPRCLVWRCLSVTGNFLPRYSHTSHVLGNKFVAVGGVNLMRYTPGVAVVNLHTGEAKEFSFPSVSKSQMLMYHRHCSVILPDSKIVILGGGGNCFSFGTHLNHTPVVVDISRCLEAVP